MALIWVLTYMNLWESSDECQITTNIEELRLSNEWGLFSLLLAALIVLVTHNFAAQFL